MNTVKPQSGFTLIEIMIVIVIISVLVGLVAPNLLGRVDEARVTAAQADIGTMEQALEMYKLDNYRYPTTDQGLQALISKPDGPALKKYKSGGYLKKGIPKDPWGGDYQYLNPGTVGDYDIFSFGADGQEGGDDYDADIGNWTE